MDFVEVIKQARTLLQSEGRIAYRTLKRQFALDDEALEDLKEELLYSTPQIVDDAGRGLIWNGEAQRVEETDAQRLGALAAVLPASAPSSQRKPETSAGERRQLTVMFCDVVGSTALSEQLDPEELQTVVRTYQEVSVQVIERYEGYIAQYLGDGLLVYFGYPAAHEDDAARAVRAGLEIVTALHQARSQFLQPLQVRIGIHTGPVVVGQMGSGSRHEQLALGETPNIAARVQGQAEPNSVVISAATARLVPGLFECQALGGQELKGVSTPLDLYSVQRESTAQSRFEVAVRTGLTPLVGRETEVEFLYQRWMQAQAGNGQAVLVSGEPGIGKSRLVEELKIQVTQEGAAQIEFRCSPYHQNTALYPIIEHLQRLLQFAPDDTPDTKLSKLQQLLGRYRFPQADTLPLLAALLSLPHPEGVPVLTTSPQKRKEQMQAALVAWLVEETEQQPVYTSWEDLHWADPSTLEVLELLLSQVPTTRLLAVLTFRPEFVPPWGTHSYLSQLTLSRLGHPQVSAMVERVTGGKPLPDEVVQQIVTKTDGVPLFVEELTKMVIESNLVREASSRYELTGPLPPLAIPSTLQDSLMARLDRLATVREVAQVGATIGREFSYELLHAVSLLEEAALQRGLQQLVEAELVYQRGLPPRARYTFKHALVQDTAYESLLRSRRQQLHKQIAQMLAQQFAETTQSQPELLAHHYTEAGLGAQAIPYWQRAGQQAIERSAYVEAIHHISRGLEVVAALPDTPERARQELSLQMALGLPLTATRSWAAPEAGQAYTRALELCRQIGQTADLARALQGLWTFYIVRGECRTAQELGEQLLSLAQRDGDPALLVEGYFALGSALHSQGAFGAARTNLEQGMAVYDPPKHRSLAFQYGAFDPGVACHSFAADVLWYLGYPDQALRRSTEAVRLAQALSHPFSLEWALSFKARAHQLRREEAAVRAGAEAVITLGTEQGFAFWLAWGTMLRGWVWAAQGQAEQGIGLLREGLQAWQSTDSAWDGPYFLALLAEAYSNKQQPQAGLRALTEGLEQVNRFGLQRSEAELYRLKGELTLQANSQSPAAAVEEAEECFRHALTIARHQEAKSLELRAATSYARLWQQQGKKAEAYQLLSEIYAWFTEGFDTADLKDAKALLATLSEGK